MLGLESRELVLGTTVIQICSAIEEGSSDVSALSDVGTREQVPAEQLR